jgi:hypothetical protein
MVFISKIFSFPKSNNYYAVSISTNGLLKPNLQHHHMIFALEFTAVIFIKQVVYIQCSVEAVNGLSNSAGEVFEKNP